MKLRTLLIPSVLLACIVGCALQPVDSVTGAKVGPPISRADPVPATNPDTGNPVVTKPSNEVDVRVLRGIANGVLPYPWNLVTDGLLIAFGAWQTSKRKKSDTAVRQVVAGNEQAKEESPELTPVLHAAQDASQDEATKKIVAALRATLPTTTKAPATLVTK